MFDENEPSVSVKGHKFMMLDEIQVEISVDRTDEQHPKIVLKLVSPIVPGLSPDDADTIKEQLKTPTD